MSIKFDDERKQNEMIQHRYKHNILDISEKVLTA